MRVDLAMNQKHHFMNRKGFLLSALILALGVHKTFADPTPFELCSPKADDHFEQTKPLLFWKAVPQAKSYEVYVDDTKAGDAPASAGPVLNFGITAPLAPGLHHWSVKAIPATGDAVSSGTSTFTIDPPADWPAWAIGPFVRYGQNPLFSPQGKGWESVNTFNPGVIFDGDRFRMLYRAQARAWTSREGYAESPDGVTFTRNPDPLIDAKEPFERGYGCEDARLFKYGGTYYTFYTGNSPKGGIALCEATSTDCVTWKKLGIVVDHTKNGAPVCDPSGTPIKINGKFAMFCGNSGFKLTYSDDLITWSPAIKLDMKLTKGWVGPFEPCVAVNDPTSAHPDDIVLFIAGTLNGKGKWFYAISEILVSKTDLTKKVDQLNDCIMKPRETYENGQNKNCLWTNAVIQHNGQWMLYYGAGDRFVALATAPVK